MTHWYFWISPRHQCDKQLGIIFTVLECDRQTNEWWDLWHSHTDVQWGNCFYSLHMNCIVNWSTRNTQEFLVLYWQIVHVLILLSTSICQSMCFFTDQTKLCYITSNTNSSDFWSRFHNVATQQHQYTEEWKQHIKQLVNVANDHNHS